METKHQLVILILSLLGTFCLVCAHRKELKTVLDWAAFTQLCFAFCLVVMSWIVYLAHLILE